MIADYDRDASDWLERHGWEENPFTLKIMPEAFVGYDDQVKDLVQHVREGHKVALVKGATGSGKTTLLSLFRDRFKGEYDVIFAQKPPTPEELVTLMVENYPLSWVDRLLGKTVTTHNLAEHVARQADRKILFMVDEAHEADVEDLEWLRTVTDHVEDMQLILAGLPTIEETLKNDLETLRNRVTTEIELVSLSEDDVKELVRRRIERHGGEGIEPFTETVLTEVYNRSGGFPREVLKQCDALVKDAIQNDRDEIMTLRGVTDTSDVRLDETEDSDTGESIATNSKDLLRDLPYKQRKIVTILSEEDDLYPSEIAQELGTDNYKTKQHAVRSVNNILRRLLNEGYVERRSRGKGYVYSLVPKVKNVLIEA